MDNIYEEKHCPSLKTLPEVRCPGYCKRWDTPGVIVDVQEGESKSVTLYQYFIDFLKGKASGGKPPNDNRVLIVENNSDTDLTAEYILSKMRSSPSDCILCEKVIDLTKKMLSQIKIVKKNETRGICNTCSEKCCGKCNPVKEAVNSLPGMKSIDNKDPNARLRNWFENMKDPKFNLKERICLKCRRTVSETTFDRLLKFKEINTDICADELYHRFKNRYCTCIHTNRLNKPTYDDNVMNFLDGGGGLSLLNIKIDNNKDSEDEKNKYVNNRRGERSNKHKTLKGHEEEKKHSKRGLNKKDENKDKFTGRSKKFQSRKQEETKEKKSGSKRGSNEKDKVKGKETETRNVKETDKEKIKKEDKRKDNDIDKAKGKEIDKRKGKEINKEIDKGKLKETDKRKDTETKEKSEKRDKDRNKTQPDSKNANLSDRNTGVSTQVDLNVANLALLRLQNLKRPELSFTNEENNITSKIYPFTEELYKQFRLDNLPKHGQVYDMKFAPCSRAVFPVNSDQKINKFPKILTARDRLILPSSGEKEKFEKMYAFSVRKAKNGRGINTSDQVETNQIIETPDISSRADILSVKFPKLIFGTKVYRYNSDLCVEQIREKEPLMFSKKEELIDNETIRKPNIHEVYNKNTKVHSVKENKRSESISTRSQKSTKSKLDITDDSTVPKGVVRYALSDREYIEKGWTILPTEKIVRKMNIYKMRPVHPERNWFECHKKVGVMHYNNGNVMAEIDENSNGLWYYRSGFVALERSSPEGQNENTRYVVLSDPSSPVDGGRQKAPATVLAFFDSQGSGLVFGMDGEIRVKYNQNEGVLVDKNIGPDTRWKWHDLNDPPYLRQVIEDTRLPFKEPKISKFGKQEKENAIDKNEDEIAAIVLEDFMKDKSKQGISDFKSFAITSKVFKINDQFSLKILDQTNVILIFRDGQSNMKVNLGLVLDPTEVIETVDAELGDIINSIDKKPASTDSLIQIQRILEKCKTYERSRIKRREQISRPISVLSVDKIRSFAYFPVIENVTKRCVY